MKKVVSEKRAHQNSGGAREDMLIGGGGASASKVLRVSEAKEF